MNKFEKEIIIYGHIDKKIVELDRYSCIYQMASFLKLDEIKSGTYCYHIRSSLYKGRLHSDFFHNVCSKNTYEFIRKARFHMFCETIDGEEVHKNEIIEAHHAYLEDKEERHRKWLVKYWHGNRSLKPRKNRYNKLPSTTSELFQNMGDYKDLRAEYGDNIVRKKRLKTNLDPWRLEKRRTYQRSWKSQRKTQYKT